MKKLNEMKAYEYKSCVIDDLLRFELDQIISTVPQENLKCKGDGGWELISTVVYKNLVIGYFKKEIITE